MIVLLTAEDSRKAMVSDDGGSDYNLVVFDCGGGSSKAAVFAVASGNFNECVKEYI